MKQDEIEVVYDAEMTREPLGYCKSGNWTGWIFTKHPDGQWVSLFKVPVMETHQACFKGGEVMKIKDLTNKQCEIIAMANNRTKWMADYRRWPTTATKKCRRKSKRLSRPLN